MLKNCGPQVFPSLFPSLPQLIGLDRRLDRLESIVDRVLVAHGVLVVPAEVLRGE